MSCWMCCTMPAVTTAASSYWPDQETSSAPESIFITCLLNAVTGTRPPRPCPTPCGNATITMLHYVNPLMPHCCHMGTAIKHPVPDRVKSSWASECPDVKNYRWLLNPVWHRILYSCIHMATMSVKGIKFKVKKCPALQSLSVIYGKEAENRWVLSLVLNDSRQHNNVTSNGKLFQVLATATWNVRSLIIESRVSGTTSAEVDDECRRWDQEVQW